ncbi:MAG: DUF4861 domain-containing protein [Bacteroidia bacterium]|nr:DUF4861 domain-containing protein [Bacteroidia bacterium]
MKILPNLLTIFILGLFLYSCNQSREETPSLIIKVEEAASGLPIIANVPVTELIDRGMSQDRDNLWYPYDAKGKMIAAQYENPKQDGNLVSLLIQTKNGEEIFFKVPESQSPTPMKTNLHIGKRNKSDIESLKHVKRLQTEHNKITYATFQYEGIGWENDLVGFRNYLDLRNGIDIFGKRTSDMVLDDVDKDQNSHYHELAAWGMDILKVGTSLGAGGIGLIYKDSLIRLTSKDADATLLNEGPLKSTFVMEFRKVDMGDKQIDVRHVISIEAGKHYYEGRLEFSDTDDLKIVIGIVDMHEAEFELIESSKHIVLNSYGIQSENKDVLSMAVMVQKNAFLEQINSRDFNSTITDTRGLSVSPDKANYRFYALWELQDEDFREKTKAISFLEKEMRLKEANLKLTWNK